MNRFFPGSILDGGVRAAKAVLDLYELRIVDLDESPLVLVERTVRLGDGHVRSKVETAHLKLLAGVLGDPLVQQIERFQRDQMKIDVVLKGDIESTLEVRVLLLHRVRRSVLELRQVLNEFHADAEVLTEKRVDLLVADDTLDLSLLEFRLEHLVAFAQTFLDRNLDVDRFGQIGLVLLFDALRQQLVVTFHLEKDGGHLGAGLHVHQLTFGVDEREHSVLDVAILETVLRDLDLVDLDTLTSLDRIDVQTIHSTDTNVFLLQKLPVDQTGGDEKGRENSDVLWLDHG